jgi:hypothetical protein
MTVVEWRGDDLCGLFPPTDGFDYIGAVTDKDHAATPGDWR